MEHLSFRSKLGEYAQQAAQLLDGWNSGDGESVELFRTRLPRFLDEKVVWLPRNLSAEELRRTPLGIGDAQLALARAYDFRDWAALQAFVASVEDASLVAHFEAAVEAVVAGDLAALAGLLRDHPELVRARSTRITHFDPPVHGATLLHYVAANGVEGYRQKAPANAVEVARMLLEAGAEVDAQATMYGEPATTLTLLVSSCHPAEAGLQVALAELLLDFGAQVEGHGQRQTPLMTALAFGYAQTAEALVRRGARVDRVAAAAGLGRLDEVHALLPSASHDDRHAAFALACLHGRTEVVRFLLDAGEDPNRYNPPGFHAHSTPLHQAIAAGQEAVVRLLVERGARLDIRDTIYQGTPLGWADYCGKPEIASYLRGMPQSAI